MKKYFVYIVIILISIINYNAYGYSEEKKIELSNQATKSPQNKFFIDNKTILRLLKNKEFNELKILLVDIENKFSEDPAYEWGYLKAYEDFDSVEGEHFETLIQSFDDWVEKDNSYVSIAARGFYISGEAQKYRGKKYVSEVPEEQLNKAGELRELANKDLRDAIKLHSNFLPAYSQLIKNYRHLSNSDEANKILHEAITQVPETYYIRQNAILFEQPKWGGKYETAQVIIDEAQRHGSKNPRLWNLRGNVYAIKGYACRKTPACAIDYYKKALAYGDKIGWITDLAYFYYKAGDYSMAIETIKKMDIYTSNKIKLEKLILCLTELAAISNAPTLLIGASAQKNGPTLGYSDFDKGW